MNSALAMELRAACAAIRRNSMPLADLIPLMQRAADALDESKPFPLDEARLKGLERRLG